MAQPLHKRGGRYKPTKVSAHLHNYPARMHRGKVIGSVVVVVVIVIVVVVMDTKIA